MTFNPDGRTLLCGLQENLKVFSWEPIRSHDTVDVGWSKLSDMNVHEGKLLGCSYNQSCVGVWVVDISRIEPYAVGKTARLNGDLDAKSNSGGSAVPTEDNVKANLGRLSISNNADPVKETRSVTRLSIPQNSDKESKSTASTVSTPSTPQKSNFNVVPKTMQMNVSTISSATNPKRSAAKAQSTANNSFFNRSDVMPVVVPRNDPRAEQAAEFRKEDVTVKALPSYLQSKTSDVRKVNNTRDAFEKTNISTQSDNELPKSMDSNAPDRSFSASVKNSIRGIAAEKKARDDKSMISRRVDTNAAIDNLARYQHESYEFRGNSTNMETSHLEAQKGGRTHLVLPNWEQKSRSSFRPGLPSSNISGRLNARSYPSTDENESVSASDEDTIADLLEQHDQFVCSMRSRLGKLQVVLDYWQRHDMRGALSAISKMGNQSVLADVMSLLAEKTDVVTLDICSCLLPLLTGLVESDMDRHQDIALDMLIKLVRVFGSVIYSSLSVPASVGVDIEAEQRLERCNLCYVELEKVKCSLPALSRRGGSIAKSAHELNLALQEVS